ncbi:MAG: hypothetical protein LAP40_17490 [Acidobacteriia bacterium]|nr:hypothetical protein [Terriglobia bacterium]
MLKNAGLMVCAVMLASGFLASCKRATQVQIQVIPGFNKTFPVVRQGDVITWTTAQGQPMQVKFDPLSPCAQSDGNPTATCHVSVAGGMYPYDCDQCDDPVIPVGSSTDNQLRGQRFVANVRSASPLFDGVYCDSSTKTASAVPETATTGSQFQWIGAGNPAQWWVTLDQGTCQGYTEFGTRNGQYKCTVMQSTPGMYMYKVHVDGCATPDGTAQLTIKASR